MAIGYVLKHVGFIEILLSLNLTLDIPASGPAEEWEVLVSADVMLDFQWGESKTQDGSRKQIKYYGAWLST